MGLFGGKAKKKAAPVEDALPPIELKPSAFDKNEAQGCSSPVGNCRAIHLR